MANETKNVNGTTLNLEHLQLRYRNKDAWEQDYILLAGEIGFELDTSKVKLGDGSTSWKDLPYFYDKAIQSVVDDLVQRIGGVETRLSAAENTIESQGTRLTTAENNITAHDTRLDTDEGNINTNTTNIATNRADIDSIFGITSIVVGGSSQE